MRKDFSERLRRTVDKMGWPGKELVLTDDLIEEWVEGVELLLDLQEPYGASSNSALFSKHSDMTNLYISGSLKHGWRPIPLTEGNHLSFSPSA